MGGSNHTRAVRGKFGTLEQIATTLNLHDLLAVDTVRHADGMVPGRSKDSQTVGGESNTWSLAVVSAQSQQLLTLRRFPHSSGVVPGRDDARAVRREAG